MIRKTLLAFSLVFTLNSFGQDIKITEGIYDASLTGLFDLDNFAGGEIGLRGGLGYFIRDYIEVGGILEYQDNKAMTRYGAHIFGEYNFETKQYLIPFVGASLGVASLDLGNLDTETGLELGVFGGAKYFLADNVALTGSLKLGLASGDTFDDFHEPTNTELRFDAGFRVMW